MHVAMHIDPFNGAARLPGVVARTVNDVFNAEIEVGVCGDISRIVAA